MPIIKIWTSRPFNIKEKDLLSEVITRDLNELASIPLDKIEIVIIKNESINIYRSAYSIHSEDFSRKSRVENDNNIKYNQYDDHLFIIDIEIWKGVTSSTKSKFSEELTKFIKKQFKIPGDNIVIYFKDVEVYDWFQNGISGEDESFIIKSRTV